MVFGRMGDGETLFLNLLLAVRDGQVACIQSGDWRLDTSFSFLMGDILKTSDAFRYLLINSPQSNNLKQWPFRVLPGVPVAFQRDLQFYNP